MEFGRISFDEAWSLIIDQEIKQSVHCTFDILEIKRTKSLQQMESVRQEDWQMVLDFRDDENSENKPDKPDLAV